MWYDCFKRPRCTATSTTNLCSASYASWQRGTARICRCATAAERWAAAAVDRYFRRHGAQQQTRRSSAPRPSDETDAQTDRQTDERTPDSFTDPRSLTTLLGQCRQIWFRYSMKFSSSRGRLLTKCSFTFTVTSLLADRALPDRLPCLADSNFVIPTARIVCEAKSMKRYGVRPSVCLSVRLSQHGPTTANSLLHVCCCEPGRQEISIDCWSSGECGQCHVVSVRK